MGLVQRAIEAAGIPTVSVTMLPELTARIGVPRALRAGFPLGRPFGPPGRPFLRASMLRAMLDVARTAREPGAIADRGFGDGGDGTCAVCGLPPEGGSS